MHVPKQGHGCTDAAKSRLLSEKSQTECVLDDAARRCAVCGLGGMQRRSQRGASIRPVVAIESRYARGERRVKLTHAAVMAVLDRGLRWFTTARGQQSDVDVLVKAKGNLGVTFVSGTVASSPTGICPRNIRQRGTEPQNGGRP